MTFLVGLKPIRTIIFYLSVRWAFPFKRKTRILNSMSPTSHCPEFINEMKAKLLAEKMELERDLNLEASMQDGSLEAKFPDYGRGEEDNATEVSDYVAMSATTQALKDRLNAVKDALMRIESGTYGVTVEGQMIPEDRLRANPSATTIIKSR